MKFSSLIFEISLKLVQVMVIGKYENKSACLIKRPEQKQTTAAILDKSNPIINTNSKPIKPVVTIPKPIVVQEPTKTVQAPIKPITMQSITKPALVKAPIKTMQEPTVTQTIKTNVNESNIQPLIKPTNMLRDSVQKTLKPIIKNTITTQNIPLTPSPPSQKSPSSTNLIKNNDIEEVNINFNDLSDSISLKNPNEVYYEIYNIAREKAKQCRMKAIEAYLEAKQIKTKYMLHDLDDSEDSDDDDEKYME